MTKMRAAVVAGVKDLQIRELDKPTPSAGEVLVKIKAVALCTVEQRSYGGIKNFGFPLIGGHEWSGIVEQIGEGVMGDWAIGDRVVGTYGYCGECYYCIRGEGQRCVNTRKNPSRIPGFEGSIIGGGLAEYVVVPSNQLIKFSDNVPFESAAVCEPMGCCIHSIEKADLDFCDNVVVIGGGIMGMLHIMLARMKGCRVFLQEPDADRRKLGEEVGAHYTYDPTEVNAAEYIKEKTDGMGAQAVFNTTAIAAVAGSVLELCAPLGKAVLYSSLHPDDPQPIKLGEMHSLETELIGTVSPGYYDMYRAAQLQSYELLSPARFIEATYPLEKAADAFEHALKPNTYRVVVTHD